MVGERRLRVSGGSRTTMGKGEGETSVVKKEMGENFVLWFCLWGEGLSVRRKGSPLRKLPASKLLAWCPPSP